jgi:hypothetical protein
MDTGTEGQWTDLAAHAGSILSASLAPTSTLVPSTSYQPDPEPARVISDIPVDPAHPPTSSPAVNTPQPTDATETPDQRSIDRRNALRLALKRKFASWTLLSGLGLPAHMTKIRKMGIGSDGSCAPQKAGDAETQERGRVSGRRSSHQAERAGCHHLLRCARRRSCPADAIPSRATCWVDFR